MDEFLNIDWHPPLDDIIDNVFINEKRLKDESVMYRIMQGLFTDPFTDFESEDSQDEDDDDEESKNVNKGVDVVKENKPVVQKPRGYVPGLIRPPFVFPRMSNLSKEQHATCLKVFLRFSAREKPEIDPKSRNELKLYMELSKTIREEQEEFLELAKANWNGSTLKIIDKEYINERWKSKVERLKKLPRYYVAAGNVPFNSEEKISVTPETTLLEIGQLPRAIIPCSKKRNVLHCSRNKLESLYPSSSDTALCKPTVSQDPNCERLAECGEADLVISSAGLNCLANNFGPNYKSSWILPIVVKESGNGNGSVIYIDKSLPPIAMTVPQRNTWLYKYILKAQLLHPNHPTSISLTEREKQEVESQNLFGDLNSEDLLKLEDQQDQFRSSNAQGKSLNSNKQARMSDVKNTDDLNASENKQEVNSPANDPQILHKLSDNSFCAEESASNKDHNIESRKFYMDSAESEKTESFSNVKMNTDDKEHIIDEEMPHDQILKTETHGYQDPRETSVPCIRPQERSNLEYKIFSLGPAEDTNEDLMKSKPKVYRILVRTQIDGIERINKETVLPIMLAPKLEHQVGLGAEAVTADEALKQWTMLTYRPNTTLLRIRISAENADVIQIERRTAISINNEIKRLYKLNVEDSLVTLHNVVHHLKTLKSGNYLLRHTPTNGAFATIYQEAVDDSAKNVLDLHNIYAKNSLQTIGNAPWPLLDTGVVTPSQICLERMPAMYNPARNDSDIKYKVTRGRGRGGLRGRGRGALRGTGRGDLQNTERGGTSRGGTRVRTKKAKKKNKGVKTEMEQS